MEEFSERIVRKRRKFVHSNHTGPAECRKPPGGVLAIWLRMIKRLKKDLIFQKNSGITPSVNPATAYERKNEACNGAL